MRNFTRIAVASVLASAALVAVPAQAEEGSLLVRVRALHIAPANKSDAINVAGVGENPSLVLPSDSLEVSSKWIPDIDFEYFWTKNISTELVLTYPQKHDVSVKGVATIGTFKHLPPTLTVKYNFLPDGAIRPYIGAGVNLTLIMNVDITVPAALSPTGSDLPVKLENHSVGAAVQAGVDFKISDHWYGNIDAKYVQIRSDVLVGGAKISAVKVDPVLLGAGVAYRF